MCSGILYKDSPEKSVALSRELVYGDEVEAAGVVVEVLMEEGAEDAKRTPAPFRIKTFVLEN